MPWSARQVRYLLSSGSPLTEKQKTKMRSELHDNPDLIRKDKVNALAIDPPRRKKKS